MKDDRKYVVRPKENYGISQKLSASKTARIIFNLIFIALLGSIGLYILIALIVTYGAVKSGRIPTQLAPNVWIFLIAVAAVAFSVGVVLSFVILKEKILIKAGSKIAAIILVIGLATASFSMMDFTAVMGLVATFMTMSPKYVYPGAVIAVMGMFFVRSRYSEWLDKVDRMFTMAES